MQNLDLSNLIFMTVNQKHVYVFKLNCVVVFKTPACVFPDEINWPEGEDAPPPDAQELITLLLRQNPLERMGAGTNPPSSLHVPPQQRSLFPSHFRGKELRSSGGGAVLSCSLLASFRPGP